MPAKILDAALCTYVRDQQRVLWRDPAAAKSLNEACRATLGAFGGPSDSRLRETVVYVNDVFASEPYPSDRPH